MTELPAPAPESAQLDCPHCQKTITYYDVRDSSFYACPKCHTYFKYEHEGPPEIIRDFRSYKPKSAMRPVIPIGSEGALLGNLYRVIGLMTKTEAGTPARWNEYLLFSPVIGYAQLAEYQGHWQFIRPANGTYAVSSEGGDTTRYYIQDEDRRYDQFHTYVPRLLFAVGEFDWNILDDDKLTVNEYVSPPFMLIHEDGGLDSSVWYRAEHLDNETVAEAFGLAIETLPTPVGAGAIEPSPGSETTDLRFVLTMRVCMAIIVIMGVIGLVRSPKTVANDTFYSTVSGKTTLTATNGPRAEFVGKSFTIDGPSAVAVKLRADVDNQWVELGVSMVNEQSGRAFEFMKSVEYYHGVEGGESWNEGDREEEAVLSRVPSGRYHLVVSPYAETELPLSINVRVTQHTILWSNLWLVLIIVAIYPVIQYLRQQSFEQRRWADSEYGVQEETE